jgi:hypothetical protein
VFQFDSSWRQETPQKGWLTVSFDGGPEIDLLRFNSESGDPAFKDSDLNETIAIAVGNPEGAQSMVVSFGYQGVNDWWWAIDNIKVFIDAVAGPEPTISISTDADGNVVVTWTGILQSADDVTGPWTDVADDSASPLTLPADQARQFARSVNP